MRPTVTLEPPADPLFRGDLEFSATADDPNGDSLTYSWGTTETCPLAIADPGQWPAWTPGTDTFKDLDETRPAFCVWVRVVDPYGAWGVDARAFTLQDHAPVAKIVVTSPDDAKSFPLHTAFMLSAEQSTDADVGDALTFAWTVSSPDPTVDLTHCAMGTLCSFKADASGSYDVQLAAFDGTDTTTIDRTLLVNPGPVPHASLELISPPPLGCSTSSMGSPDAAVPDCDGPYPLGTTFKVSGAPSTGGDADDPLPYNWFFDHGGALGSNTSLGACADDDAMDARCFTADAPGTYVVGLSVDGESTAPAVTLKLEVLPDQPPCIGMTEPPASAHNISVDSMKDFDFTVDTIQDDLDPFGEMQTLMPAMAQAALFGAPTFQWFANTGGGFVSVWPNSPTYTIYAKTYPPAHEVAVRLEVSDANRDRSLAEFAGCMTDECSFANDGCLQRVTWMVSFF